MIQKLFTTLALLLLAPAAWAAPTFDTTAANQTAGGSATSCSTTHNASGSNRVGYLAVFINNAAGTDPSSSATWNSVSMTKKTTKGIASGEILIVFELAGISTGSQTVTASWTGTFDAKCVSISYTDVDQGTPSGTPATASSGGEESSSINVTSASGETVLDFLGIRADSLTAGPTADGTQTQRINSPFSGGDYLNLYGSEKAGSGTTAMSWTWTGASGRYHIGIPLKPVTAGSPSGAFRRRF